MAEFRLSSSDQNTAPWFKISKWSGLIEPVLAVKVSDTMITLAADEYQRERRHRRIGVFESYHPTWKDAHAALLKKAEDNLRNARSALQQAQDYLGNVKGMKPPEGVW